MKRKDFYFDLPPDRIARFPSEKREESRLMVVERKTGKISHHRFKDIADMIGPGDFLVVNNSKVIPVRLFGNIGGKKADLLLVKILGEQEAEALTQPARKFKLGAKVSVGHDIGGEVIGIGHRGKRTIRFNRPIESVLKEGFAPLPPYIKRKFPEALSFKTLDLERYQTVYSKIPGSIAAPTAGLHFTPGILEKIRQKTEILEITLAVGEATFRKIETEDIAGHRMGREYITINRETGKQIPRLKAFKNLVAVGTTTVRSLETFALQEPGEETFYSELFISPGFEFKMVDKMVTNFHLPESSLFILVSAFAGLESMQEAYRIAIKEGYRFFSFGDAMFIT